MGSGGGCRLPMVLCHRAIHLCGHCQYDGRCRMGGRWGWARRAGCSRSAGDLLEVATSNRWHLPGDIGGEPSRFVCTTASTAPRQTKAGLQGGDRCPAAAGPALSSDIHPPGPAIRVGPLPVVDPGRAGRLGLSRDHLEAIEAATGLSSPSSNRNPSPSVTWSCATSCLGYPPNLHHLERVAIARCARPA